MGINLGKRLKPSGTTTDESFSLDSIKDIFETLRNPLLTIEDLEKIDEERYVPLGDDGFSLIHPEFEEFDDPLGWLIDVMTGGLLDVEFKIHLAWNDCEVFLSVEGKISMYEISDDKNSGGGISYRRKTPECQPPKPPPPPPKPPIPPRPPIPSDGAICCVSGLVLRVDKWASGVAPCNPKAPGLNYDLFFPEPENKEQKYTHSGCSVHIISQEAGKIPGGGTWVSGGGTWIKLPLNPGSWGSAITSARNSRRPLTGLNTHGFNTHISRVMLKGKVTYCSITSNEAFAYTIKGFSSNCLNGQPNIPESPDIPESPEKKRPSPWNDEDEEMRCCKNSRDSEELLKRLSKKLDKICKSIGVDDLPLTTPKSFIRGNDRDIKLTSLAQIQNHTLEQIDAVAGEFPIKVKIKDADPLKKGDQGVEVELPNIAEALAEMYGLIFETDSYVGVVVDYCSRLSAELLSVRAGTAKNLAYNQAITKFLGFDTDVKYKSIRTAFEQGILGKNLYLGYVKNTDRETLKDYLSRLMYSASIIKLAYMKTEDDLESWKKKAEEAEKNKNAKGGTDPEKLWDDFVDYLNKDGFINRTPGAIEPKAREIPFTNPLKPQGD